MRKLFLFLMLCTGMVWGQNCDNIPKEWHVKPFPDAEYQPSGGNGSLNNPWSLHEALTDTLAVQPGDIIWMHGGVYRGHFKSILRGCEEKYIRVVGVEEDTLRPIIDGNIFVDTNGVIQESIEVPGFPLTGIDSTYILEVASKFVRYENFQVTCLGNFERFNRAYCPDNKFRKYVGIQHEAYVNKFINLVVSNIPGIGMGSWKETADTEIYGCIFYYNGQLDPEPENPALPANHPVNVWYCGNVPLTTKNVRGYENCVYTQNNTNLKRLFENNIFLNNYQSGIGAWSAKEAAEEPDYVKNFNIVRNIFINNGSPARDETPNLKVATADKTGINRPVGIKIDQNYFYFNQHSSNISGMLIENSKGVDITNNFIFKGDHGPRLGIKNINLKYLNNFYWGKSIGISIDPADYSTANWKIDNNIYYHWPDRPLYKKETGIWYDYDDAGIILNSFQHIFHDDFNSQYQGDLYRYDDWTFEPLLVWPDPNYMLTQNRYDHNKFHLVVFDPSPQDDNTVEVDFSGYGIPPNTPFTVIDAQDLYGQEVTMPNGNQTSGSTIVFPVEWSGFESLPSYGVQFVPHIGWDENPTGVPIHTGMDLNVYVIQFGCSALSDLHIDYETDNSAENYFAGNTVILGTEYVADTSADVIAKAGKSVTLMANTHIRPGSRLHAYIEPGCGQLPYVGEPAISVTPELKPAAPKSPKADLFRIHPNPSNGIFKVESLNDRKIVHVTVLRLDTARKVFEKDGDQKILEVDIASQPEGLYAVKVTFDDDTYDAKTVIKK